MSQPSTSSSSPTKKTRTKRKQGKRGVRKNVKVNQPPSTWPYIDMFLQKMKGLDSVNDQLSTVDPSTILQGVHSSSHFSSQESMAKFYLQSIVQTTIPAQYPYCLKPLKIFQNTTLLTFDKEKCTQAFATHSDELKQNPYNLADPVGKNFIEYFIKKATGPRTGKFKLDCYWQLARHFEMWAKGVSNTTDGREDDNIPFVKCIVSQNDECEGEFEKILIPIHVPFYMLHCLDSLVWFFNYLFSMKYNPRRQETCVCT